MYCKNLTKMMGILHEDINAFLLYLLHYSLNIYRSEKYFLRNLYRRKLKALFVSSASFRYVLRFLR
jgi:hypothetical protein